jgi:hypothetical protein
MPKVTFIQKRYASMEFNVDGKTWDVFNDVTGLLAKEAVGYVAAITAVGEINNHYHTVEFGRAN